MSANLELYVFFWGSSLTLIVLISSHFISFDTGRVSKMGLQDPPATYKDIYMEVTLFHRC